MKCHYWVSTAVLAGVLCFTVRPHQGAVNNSATNTNAIPDTCSIPLSNSDAWLKQMQQGDELYSSGKYDEATVEYMGAVEKGGPTAEHNLCLAIRLGNLARAYSTRGQYVRALPISRLSIHIFEVATTDDDPGLATHLNQLGDLYLKLGRFGDAEPLYRRALKILSANSPRRTDLLATKTNYATLCYDTARYAEAESLFNGVLNESQELLGSTHPGVANAMNNLGTVYVAEGRYSEAELLYKRSLKIAQTNPATKAVDLAIALSNLGLLYNKVARFGSAEGALHKALDIQERELGPEHPATALTMINLANACANLGHYQDAENLYVRGMHTTEKAVGPNHPQYALALTNLAGLYALQHRFNEAETLFEKALTTCERTLGQDHPDTAVVLNNLAVVNFWQRRYPEANVGFKRSLAILESTLGTNHPQVAKVKLKYAVLLRAMKRNAEAKQLEASAKEVLATQAEQDASKSVVDVQQLKHNN